MEFLLNASSMTDFLATALRLSIPVAFAALGGVLAERSGVYNIALEGLILTGAFGAALGAFMTGSPLGGIAVGLAAALCTAALLSLLAVTLKVNQIVAGIAINLLVLGLTAYLARLAFGQSAAARALPGFAPVPVPVLSEIPVIGPVLFAQDPLVYLLYATVPALAWMLARTPVGLRIRATGENPAAADAAGVPVFLLRHLAVLGSGVLAGMGGCYLVLTQVFLFTEHMSAGKGFIALAAVILGRWSPVGAVLAALLFGFFDALQLRLQFANPGVPYQVFVVLPYVASILALVGLYGRYRPPAAVGVPYRREQR